MVAILNDYEVCKVVGGCACTCLDMKGCLVGRDEKKDCQECKTTCESEGLKFVYCV